MSLMQLIPAYNTVTSSNSSSQSYKSGQKVTNNSFSNYLEIENNLKADKARLSNIKHNDKNYLPKSSSNAISLSSSKNFIQHNQSEKNDGMNLALKEKADELAEMVVGVLLNFAMTTEVSPQGGFAEGVYRQEATFEQVNNVAKDLVDDLSAQFYEESLRDEINKKDSSG